MHCGTNHAARRDRPRFAASKAAGLVACFWILAPSTAAQKNPPATAESDPFIAAIATIKHSVGSMDCLAVSGSEAKILRRMASAFLISQEADFLTAAHVVTAMQQSGDRCPTPAITLAVGDWRPDVPAEAMLWFPFRIADCKVDDTIDVAECRPSGDLPARIRKLHKATPVQLEWSLQPDGTELAFTGFPLEARDPMTFRAHVAAYETPWPDQATPQLVLDHAGLPGFSGSPVFLANGKVVAIQVKDGSPDAPGTSIARPSSAFQKLLEERSQKE